MQHYSFTKSHDATNTPPSLPNAREVYSQRPRAISRPRQLRRSAATSQSTLYVHPINTLPVEILLLIFEIGAAANEHFPVNVSHVCKYWRQLALGTPSLWCHIILGSRGPMSRERFRRAQGCSLNIQLAPFRLTPSGNRRSQDLNPYTVNWYLQLAQPYVQQWRSLDVRFAEYSPCLWKAAMAACDCPAPLLEELFLVYRLNDDTQEFFPFLGYAPRLRRVTVDGIRLAWVPSLFANLTYLDYTHHGLTSGHQAVHDVVSILSVSARLVQFRVLFPRGQIARLPPLPYYEMKPVVLPYLKQLQLTSNGSDIPFEIAHLVVLMTTPCLTSLRLVDLTRSHQSFASLKSFFYVYALPPSLHFVSISHGWYNPNMIHAMSHSLPNLISIHVKRTRSPEQVLKIKPRVRRIPSLAFTAKPVLVDSWKGPYCNHYDKH